MAHRSHSNPPYCNTSFDCSEVSQNEPFECSSQTSTRHLQIQIINTKYQAQYKSFTKAYHRRTKSQIQKINRILQDAKDLNEILNTGSMKPGREDRDLILPEKTNPVETVISRKQLNLRKPKQLRRTHLG